MTSEIVAVAAQKGFRFGLLVSAYGFGFRHGIDWDHIAAITDITSSQETHRRSLFFGTLYALGHASVVFALGVAAIIAGEKLPSGVDKVMEKIVGVTLLLLGVYVFTSLIRHGRDFRMRSRWMLVFAGVRKAFRWARDRKNTRAPELVPAGDSEAPLPEDAEVVPATHHGHHGRLGHHHHRVPEKDDPFGTYGKGTAVAVGMIHGVGAETPTQVLIFLAAAGSGGAKVGVLVLLAFIVGLLTSNTLITMTSTYGYLTAAGNFAVYATVAVLTGTFSLVIGALFLLGKATFLPAIFGG